MNQAQEVITPAVTGRDPSLRQPILQRTGVWFTCHNAQLTCADNPSVSVFQQCPGNTIST